MGPPSPRWEDDGSPDENTSHQRANGGSSRPARSVNDRSWWALISSSEAVKEKTKTSRHSCLPCGPFPLRRLSPCKYWGERRSDMWCNKTSPAVQTAARPSRGIRMNESRGGISRTLFGFYLSGGGCRSGGGGNVVRHFNRPAVNQQTPSPYPPPCVNTEKAWGISLIHGLRKWGWEIAEWLKRPQWNSGSRLNKGSRSVGLFEEAGVWSNSNSDEWKYTCFREQGWSLRPARC